MTSVVSNVGSKYYCSTTNAMLDFISPHQEGIAVGRTFASLKDYQIDGNKEMMAIGLMNVVGSCTSCYVTTGTVFGPK